ncbi:MAG: thioesterase [Synergistaceae bacterium]|nr:thioesterase [Synergistaceae bacterium]
MFERIYTVLPSDVGTAGVMKPRNLLNCLQDTADMAVTALKADVQSVLENGYAWILVHVKMSAERWPGLGEKIAVRTWHNVNEGLYTLRAFDLRSGDGRELMSGCTSWLLLDLVRSRPVKPKKNLPQIFVVEGEEYPSISGDFTELPREFSEGENARKKSYEVRLHDLDANDHVNNAVYIEWAVESVPREVTANCRLSGWEVNYRKGAYLGDEVIVNTQEDIIYENDSSVKIFTGTMMAGQTFLCTVRTYWR